MLLFLCIFDNINAVLVRMKGFLLILLTPNFRCIFVSEMHSQFQESDQCLVAKKRQVLTLLFTVAGLLFLCADHSSSCSVWQ